MVSSTLDARPRHVDLLVLGSGFIGTYTVAQAREKGHSVVSTTRDGRNDTLEWSFDPLATDSSSFTTLPTAQTVLVSFPVKEKGGISKLVRFYEETHGGKTGWIYLGSTGIYEYSNERPGEPEPPGAPQPDTHHFFTRHSPYNRLNDRAQSEEELLAYAKGR